MNSARLFTAPSDAAMSLIYRGSHERAVTAPAHDRPHRGRFQQSFLSELQARLSDMKASPSTSCAWQTLRLTTLLDILKRACSDSLDAALHRACSEAHANHLSPKSGHMYIMEELSKGVRGTESWGGGVVHALLKDINREVKAVYEETLLPLYMSASLVELQRSRPVQAFDMERYR